MDSARLRVLQVIPSLYHGGLERVAVDLTLALAADPAVERVVVASSGGSPLDRDLRAAGIQILPIPRPFPRPTPLVRSSLALRRILRDERPAVVHAHNPGAGAAAAAGRSLARASQVPVVSTFHGVLPERIRRAVRALRYSDAVVGVSETTTRSLLEAGLDPARSRTILNAVDPHPGRPREEVRAELRVDGPLVVTVGRYVAEKNQRLLLEALAHLQVPARGLVVGYGPRQETLREQAAELGLHPETVIGRRDDTPDLIAAADVFALSSDSEALPLVVLEAMALGTPVVSTDVGGVADVVRDGETGLLVPPGDAAALAGAIDRVLADRELAGRLAGAGRRFVADHCSVAAMTRAYLELYAEEIARRAGARPST